MAAVGRTSLAEFTRLAWSAVEGDRPLVWGWHLDAKCEHLEAVTRGQLTNLVITEPPGCTKSRLVGVFWPAWTWLDRPDFRWLFFANSDDLVVKESLACRRLVEGDWFRDVFPDAVRLRADQNAKGWYETEAGGHRQSMSILASVTGKKGDAVVVDDANDAEKVQSEAHRRQINARWDQAIYDRVIDYKTGRRVLTAQRTHQQDLIGHVLATGEYEHLCIPEEFEASRRYTTSIGWTDPRQTEGEFLRLGQFGPDQKAAAVKRLGTLGWRAKHQQDPQSLEGHLFRRAWFERRWTRDQQSPHWVILQHGDEPPYRVNLAATERHATADGAASAKTEADYTAVSTFVVTGRGDLLWLGCERERLEIPDQPKLLASGFERYRWKTIGVEAVASNRALFQMAQRLGLAAFPLTPKGLDKLAHAQGAIVEAEQGRVWLPGPGEAPDFPLDAVLAELLTFDGKGAGHDDVVDTLSYMVDRKPFVMTGSGKSAAPSAWSAPDPFRRGGSPTPRRPSA